jgi:hypothetical protein
MMRTMRERVVTGGGGNVGGCYYFAYADTYQAMRAAVRARDVGEVARLERLVSQHPVATIRQLGAIAIRDALAALPLRSQEHLCRFHLSPECEGLRPLDCEREVA